MYEIARSLAAVADSPRLLGLIIDRLAVDRPGRAFFYLPPETPIELERFVRDFTAFAQVDDFGHPQFGSLEWPVHSAILSGLGRVRHEGQSASAQCTGNHWADAGRAFVFARERLALGSI